jgi:hypothetical protein
MRTDTPCRCAKREGLGLLLACRAINEVASPIFWSGNTFCFLDGNEFVTTVGKRLRRGNRLRLRSVAIMNPAKDGMPILVSRPHNWKMKTFWAALGQCAALRYLELPATYLGDYTGMYDYYSPVSDALNRLADDCPALEAIHFNHLVAFGHHNNSDWLGYPLWWHHDQGGDPIPDVVYASFARPLPLRRRPDEEPWTEATVREADRDNTYNFRVHVIRAIRTQLLGSSLSSAQDCQTTFDLAHGLNSDDNVRRLKLVTGRKADVTLYGLPSGPESRLAALRRQTVRDREQRSKTGRREAEHGAKLVAKARQRRERLDSAANERDRHSETLVARQRTRDELDEAEARDTRRDKQKGRQALARADKRRKELARSERKKVLRL